jgi:signal transduction histidine kinase
MIDPEVPPQDRMFEMNQSLILGSLRQHELTAAADLATERLQLEIDERKKSQEALLKAQAELSKYASNLEDMVTQRTVELTATNQQLEAFVYSIAHDLRAPLRAMQGYSTMLIEHEGPALSEIGAGYANRINKAAQYMDALLSDLLAFSRISQQNVVLTEIDLQAVVEQVVGRLRGPIEEQHAKIQIAGLWPMVLAHEPTLVQVIFNLVSNALKFVVADRVPTITFQVENRGDRTRLWIEDNGLGIPLDYQEQIFRLFTRLNGEKFPGTGIGLAIVQKGVERLGGRLGLESTPGEGSRFWIELQRA